MIDGEKRERRSQGRSVDLKRYCRASMRQISAKRKKYWEKGLTLKIYTSANQVKVRTGENERNNNNKPKEEDVDANKNNQLSKERQSTGIKIIGEENTTKSESVGKCEV